MDVVPRTRTLLSIAIGSRPVDYTFDTCWLTAQYVKGVIDRSFAGVISNYLYDVASALSGISQFCRNLLLCVSH